MGLIFLLWHGAIKERDMIQSSQQPKFNIRLPLEFRESIKVIAKSHGRSMNTEIVTALHEYIVKNSEALTALTAKASNISQTATNDIGDTSCIV